MCFPQELTLPLDYELDGSYTRFPVLLPPQEAFGATDGLPPVPLGDVAFRTRGGNTGSLARLETAVDTVYPKAEAEQGPWIMSVTLIPERPIYGLSRTIPPRTPTVPVLFVLGKGKLDADTRGWPPFADLSGGGLPLVDTWEYEDTFFFVVPNLPFLNGCHEEEGFYHLLPEIVRYFEEEYGTAWLVEVCGFTASYRGRLFSPLPAAAGMRRCGW